MRKKRVLILGGGLLQVPLILKAREKGFEVCLSDYYEDPPGKRFCHHSSRISTVSLEENLIYAGEMNIDYVLTAGTDQPVYTAAYVSEKLGLAHPITGEQGKMVTNKQFMKARMMERGIPTPDFRVFSGRSAPDMQDMKYPLVVKPVDSQGQRGIFVLDGSESAGEVKEVFEQAGSHSITGSVIVEEFYSGDEITVNCWVKDGEPFVLMTTDRLHFDDTVVLGLCKQQRFPSRAAEGRERELTHLTGEISAAFGIEDGPLYIQAVAGPEGLKVIEFGYRVGGGFESETVPRVTGIDILELYLNLVTEGKNNFRPEEIKERARLGSIFFMLAKPGQVTKIRVPEGFDRYGKLFVKEGAEIGEICNATSRIGCFSCYTDDPDDYYKFLSNLDSHIGIYDRENRDILIHNIWE
ncbi:MAG: hypothetical protein CVU89_12585 [Firmicutes bacterium HGW-Firmicutes-14]|nr:MAG: hypothetical protein CVU89_12585 [Firmicutes bacterium HGW-Firmicutes-14]